MFSYLKKLFLCITLAIGYIFFLNLQNIWVQEKIDRFISNIKQTHEDINISISNIHSSWIFQIRCPIIRIQAYNICLNIDNLTLTCYPNIWPLTRMQNSITADRCEIYMPQEHKDPIIANLTYPVLDKWVSTALNINTTLPIHFIGCNHLIIYQNGHELYKCEIYGNISSLYHGHISIVPIIRDNIYMSNISCEYNIDTTNIDTHDNVCCNILYNIYGDSISWNIIEKLAPKAIVNKLNRTPIPKLIQQYTPGELLFRKNADTFEISCKMLPKTTCNQKILNESFLFSNWDIAYVIHQNNSSELVSNIKIYPINRINMKVACDVQTRITFDSLSISISSKINNLSLYNYELAPINIQCDCSLQKHSDQRSIISATGEVNDTPFYLSISCEQNQQKTDYLYDLFFQLDSILVTGTINDQNHLLNGSINTNIRDMNIVHNIIPGLSIGALNNRIDIIDNLKVSSVTKLKHIKYNRYCVYDITLYNTMTLDLDNIESTWESEHLNIQMRSINFDSIHLQNIVLSISKNNTHPLHARINGIWFTPFEIELLGKLQADFKTLNIRISKLTGHINDIHINQQEEINILLSNDYCNINNVHITFGTTGRLYGHAHLTPLRYFALLKIKDINLNNPTLINNLHIINNFHLDLLCLPQEHIYHINQSCILNDNRIIISSSINIDNSIHITQKTNINNQLNYDFEFFAPYYDGNKLWKELLHQPKMHASLIINGQLVELQHILNIPISGDIKGDINIHTDDNGVISSAGFLNCSGTCLVYNQEYPITFQTNLKCNREYIVLDNTQISFANVEHSAYLTGIVNLQPNIPYYIIHINMDPAPISNLYHNAKYTTTGHMTTKLKLEGDIYSSKLSGNINFLDLAVDIYSKKYNHNNRTPLYTDNIILDSDNINTSVPVNSSDFWTKLPISLNIKIIFDTPLELYWDSHTTKWKGTIDIAGYIDNPHFQGQVDLISGTYKLAHRSFSLTKGICLLQKSSLADAIWSLEGVTTLNQYTIKAYLEKINSHISVTLKSYPSLPEDKLLSMIIFGENSSYVQNHYTSTGNIAEQLWHLTMGNSSYSIIKAIYNNIKIYNEDGIKVGLPIHEKCFLGIGECVDYNHPRGECGDYRHTPRVNVLYSEIAIAEQLKILINTGYKYFKLSAKGRIEF